MMIWAFRQLATPCNYLRIRHGEDVFRSKLVYDLILPGLLAGGTLAVALICDMPLSVLEDKELFGAMSGLLAILIGFYMAALAAVSTFDRAGIDNKLEGHDALLSVRRTDGRGRVDKKLSYRQFISYLFGYASFLSFIIYVALFLGKSVWSKMEAAVRQIRFGPEVMVYGIEPLSFYLTAFFMWQLFLVSLLGIYFLAERIQELHET
ncbi:hypothetical protein [Brevundimonas subvibrioides]|uniref:hypothetical protein n=1 Tax=Brevundimonas subvibrioides TaxID=74313 RepID=UPI0022B2E0B0|nr:hypothetical protein [Brevundimonas subvibrioides]